MYYLSIVEKYMDSTPAAASIFIYETYNQALSEFYYKMWAGMNATNIKSIMVTIQDDLGGNNLRCERWVRPEETNIE